MIHFMIETVIVKYNAGNVQSVLYALERVGFEATLSDDPAVIQKADKVIFPGVGHARSAMNFLKEKGLDTTLKNLEQPTLGICLGMQLMCSHSEEGNTPCLGIFEEPVLEFKGMEQGLKVPQIGWNQIGSLKSPLFEGVSEGSFIYLVHGYYAAVGQHTIATSEYIQPYSTALHRDNFYGVQFHPEKSAKIGEQILYNFMTKI